MQNFYTEPGNADLLRIFLNSELARLKTFAAIVRAATWDGRTEDAELANARLTHILSSTKELLTYLPQDEQSRVEEQLAAVEWDLERPYHSPLRRPGKGIRIVAASVKPA